MDDMNNAVIYLLNDTEEDKQTFIKSIESLYYNYLIDHPCDVICFHEPNFCKKELTFIKDKFKFINLKTHQIDFKVPEYNPEIKNQILEYFPHPDEFHRNRGHIGFSMGYRHMCRFYAGEFMKLPIIQKYKYIWRLDTDSYILDKINYNVFDRMAENNAIYGYINIQNDHIGAIKNLWETCEAYFSKENCIFKDENKGIHFKRVYYSNFEIFNMEWFKDKPYQNFYNYIDSTGGIFINRWGDHVLRYIALNALGQKDRCLFFHDIHYYHSGVFLNTEIVNN